MSRLVHFDCHSGISGDMTLGALLDAGVPARELRKELRRLPLKGWRLRVEETTRCGLAATRATVLLSKSARQPHRHYGDIQAMLKETPLPERAARRARKAFELLGRAEAAVHKVPLSKVHFHEVGALDAIIDIVGSMIGLEWLEAQRFSASTVAVGSGRVVCDHGELPVPAPATARLLQGVPIEAGPVEAEMTTPTGAAILTALKPRFGALGPMRLERTAYGAGAREFPKHANCLRLLIGTAEGRAAGPGALETSVLCLLTTEIDDMNPEFYGPLLERLFEAGCLDAVLAPIVMKKGRPGISARVLVEEAKRDQAVEILLRHTSTFGVKVQAVERHCLRRKIDRARTPFGPVRVKIGFWGDEAIKASPEYEDCRRLAEKHAMPIAEVYRAALEAIDARGRPEARRG
jgi:uncharacterized protein (TIGR00299 family) protein